MAYFAREVLQVELHPGQKKWLDNSNKRENILVTGNRWGKSFVSAVKIIHHVLFKPRLRKFDQNKKYRIVTASITQDQANIIFNQVTAFIKQSGFLESLLNSSTKTPYPRLEFGNGAIVEARSTQNRGEYLLGNDYDLFLFDEVAFESDPEYVVENVIQMRLADREGKLDLVSTPNGKNWFYLRAREVIDKIRDGYFQSGDSRENINISADFLKEQIRYFSLQRVQQNIMGQFVDAGNEILKGEYVDRALSKYAEMKRDKDGFKNTETPVFISGWDLARKKTATVGITVVVNDGFVRIVALERFKMFDWDIVIEKIKQRQLKFPGRLVVDATGLGDVVVEQLKEYNPEAVIFSSATKAALLTNVELFHARGKIVYTRWELTDGPGKIWSLEDELRQARWDSNNEYDALMALALALWPLRKRSIPAVAPRVGKV